MVQKNCFHSNSHKQLLPTQPRIGEQKQHWMITNGDETHAHAISSHHIYFKRLPAYGQEIQTSEQHKQVMTTCNEKNGRRSIPHRETLLRSCLLQSRWVQSIGIRITHGSYARIIIDFSICHKLINSHMCPSTANMFRRSWFRNGYPLYLILCQTHRTYVSFAIFFAHNILMCFIEGL